MSPRPQSDADISIKHSIKQFIANTQDNRIAMTKVLYATFTVNRSRTETTSLFVIYLLYVPQRMCLLNHASSTAGPLSSCPPVVGVACPSLCLSTVDHIGQVFSRTLDNAAQTAQLLRVLERHSTRDSQQAHHFYSLTLQRLRVLARNAADQSRAAASTVDQQTLHHFCDARPAVHAPYR